MTKRNIPIESDSLAVEIDLDKNNIDLTQSPTSPTSLTAAQLMLQSVNNDTALDETRATLELLAGAATTDDHDIESVLGALIDISDKSAQGGAKLYDKN